VLLPHDEVHVWQADLRVEQSYATSLFALLGSEERERATRFKVPGPRTEFVVSHAFLRLTLARYLRRKPAEVRYRLMAHGKPELTVGGNLAFNLSHTDGAAVLAIARDRAVGIDIERVRPDIEAMDLANRFFSVAEVQWLHSQPVSEQLTAFFAVWTAKEALLKAHGTGFSTSLADFTVIPKLGDANVDVEIHSDQLPRNWSVSQLSFGPEYRAALAVQGKAIPIRRASWAWPTDIVAEQ
jgi:4'-phosphopantetheinyl transferase